MGAGATILRVLSGFMQVGFAISAVGLIIFAAFSGFLILESNSEAAIHQYGTLIPAGITIILAFLLIIFLIVGCCGVCRESTCCMETYSAFLILLALGHLGLGTYCTITYNNIVYVFNLEQELELGLDRMVQNYDSYRDKVDTTQSWLECCGNKNPQEEYRNYRGEINVDKYFSIRLPETSNEVPASCCRQEIPCSINSNDRHLENCSKNVLGFTVGANVLMGWLSLAIGSIELFAALLGICLSCCIWRQRTTSWR